MRAGFPRWVGQPEAVQARPHRQRAARDRRTPIPRARSTTRRDSSPSVRAASGRPHDGGQLLGLQAAAGACLAVAGSDELELSRTATSSRRARRPTHCVRRRRARTPFKTCSRRASCTHADRFQQPRTSRRPTLGAASTAEHGQLDQLGAGAGHRRRQNIHGHHDGRASSLDPRRRGALAPGGDQHGHGPTTPPEVVVFYGGNDGVLRAINGNRTASIGSVAAGDGDVGLHAARVLSAHQAAARQHDTDRLLRQHLHRRRTAAQALRHRRADHCAYTGPRTHDLWLFAAMRRGGRTIYAFDVSAITHRRHEPDAQVEEWLSRPADDTGCTPASRRWARPGAHPGPEGSRLHAASRPGDCAEADVDHGRRIRHLRRRRPGHLHARYAPRATGSMCSMPTPATWLTDVHHRPRGRVRRLRHQGRATGLAKWAYAADLGGNIYRIGPARVPMRNSDRPHPADLDDDQDRLARLRHGRPACSANRKFMMPLDVVEDPKADYVILVGSGDREKPLMGFDIGVRRRATTSSRSWTIRRTPPGCRVETQLRRPDLPQFAARHRRPGSDSADPGTAAHPKGWYLATEPARAGRDLRHHGVRHDDVQHAHARTCPCAGACSSTLGTASVYNIAFANAASPERHCRTAVEVIVGGGLPPSPVAGMVTLDDGDDGPVPDRRRNQLAARRQEPIPSGLADAAEEPRHTGTSTSNLGHRRWPTAGMAAVRGRAGDPAAAASRWSSC